MQTVQELGYANLEYDRIVFPHLGIDVTIDSTAFTIFGVEVQWYGLIITFGLLLAMIVGFSHMRRVGIDPDRAIDGVIGGIIGGLVGARMYYVIFNWEQYAGNWKEILNTRNGGLAIYGGLIGAILVGAVVCKLRKVSLLPMLDLVGVCFLLGQGIGRWGNFTNQEAFGYNTDSVFGMTGGKIQYWIYQNYTSVGDPTLSLEYPVHPCFLYESVWCLLGFALLLLTLRKWRKFDGQVFLMYIGWYGLGRFVIEGLRTDSLMMGSLRVSQMLAAVCVIAAILMLIIFGSMVKRMGVDYVLYCNTKESKALLAEADARAEEYAEKKRKQREEREKKRAAKEDAKADSEEQAEKIIPDEEPASEQDTDNNQEDETDGTVD